MRCVRRRYIGSAVLVCCEQLTGSSIELGRLGFRLGKSPLREARFRRIGHPDRSRFTLGVDLSAFTIRLANRDPM